MKTLLALGSSLAFLLVAGVSNAAVTNYTATLSGDQETPAVATAATATATLTFNDANNKLMGTVTFTGLTPNAGHVHVGACGVGGGGLAGTPNAFANPATSPITVNTTLSA